VAEHVMQSSFGIRQFVSVRRRNMLLGATGGSSRPNCQVNVRITQYIGTEIAEPTFVPSNSIGLGIGLGPGCLWPPLGKIG
jgi:hypothetical protein